MITLNGTAGEGGGQVLRTALGLSLATGTPFQIEQIRGKRKKPGLLRQHLTAVRAATAIGRAEVRGDSLKSSFLSFVPSTVQGGTYHFAIGTAGSCILVLQAVLPGLLQADRQSELILEGGTHNPMAPTFDFLTATFLPQLAKMGIRVTAELIRPGFYPAGGGRIRVRIQPTAEIQPIELCSWNFSHFTVQAVCAALPAHIGLRELKKVACKLQLDREGKMIQLDQCGPGNVVTIHAHSRTLTETFTGFGQKNVRAEKVAARAAGLAAKYRDTEAVVGTRLADQLLIPMALAGAGRFITAEPTLHTLTNIEVIEQFLPVRFQVSRISEQQWQIAL
jgi:RNA 3'-terminal phosphate cyclase (ATP)